MIQSLDGVLEINGKQVMTNSERPVNKETGETDWAAFDEMRNDFPICIDHNTDMISVKMLTKPASEGGNLNLCQCTDLVALGLEQLKYLNAKFPCKENAMSITHIEEALNWQHARTRNRVARNVEGKNEA